VDAPVRKEEARVTLQVTTPPTVITLNGSVSVIAEDPSAAFESARAAVGASGGQVVGGGMTDHVDGSRGTLQIRVDSARARALIDQLESLGEVQSSTVTQQQPPGNSGLRRERGEILLSIASPATLVGRSEGIGAVFRETISGSIVGILWSLEMLVVGIAYGGPWLLVVLLLVVIYRRTTLNKTMGKKTEGV
jgi:acetolactate synthase regulatory subunit